MAKRERWKGKSQRKGCHNFTVPTHPLKNNNEEATRTASSPKVPHSAHSVTEKQREKHSVAKNSPGTAFVSAQSTFTLIISNQQDITVGVHRQHIYDVLCKRSGNKRGRVNTHIFSAKASHCTSQHTRVSCRSKAKQRVLALVGKRAQQWRQAKKSCAFVEEQALAVHFKKILHFSGKNAPIIELSRLIIRDYHA